MNLSIPIRPVARSMGWLLLLMGLVWSQAAAAPTSQPESSSSSLAAPVKPLTPDQVDLSGLSRLAVFDGRAKTLGTWAGEHLQRIYGKNRWKDLTDPHARSHDPLFTTLDLEFRPEAYSDKPLIYVEVLAFRQELLSVLGMNPTDQQVWLQRGRLAPSHFAQMKVQQVIAQADADMLRLKARNQVMGALSETAVSFGSLPLLAPEKEGDLWQSLSSLTGASLQEGSPSVQALSAYFLLRRAWQQGDAVLVNRAMAQLTQSLAQIHPENYPSPFRRQLEQVYTRTDRMTIGYVAYALATILLLLAFATGRRGLIATGVSFLGLGLAIHLAAMIVRGVLAQRWPIHNQYESHIAISFFAVLVGLILMAVRRQWLFGAAAAALGAGTLLLANTLAIPSKDVAPVAGILDTSRILYVHVNLVLASYGLIALGLFLSLFYLVVHYGQGRAAQRFAAVSLGHVQAGGAEDRAAGAVQGATLSRSLHDLDRAQMIVLQLAFWLLGLGILLGAYWADHAWGRFWGWDPKETWALVTWIIYLIVIHVRFSAKRRGLVTAWLSVLGFIVMLWTYWGVNILLPGLHSYA